MRFGVQHGIGDSRWVPEIITPREVRRFAETAERVGYDAIAFTDHPAPSVRWVESGGEGVADLFTSLAFCAAVTTRVRLLSWVLVPPYRNPFVTAHQVATLDRLSEGRVTLGIGAGYLKSEFHALGIDPNRRVELLEDGIGVMKQVWAGRDVDHEGDGYSARGVRAVPAAVQDPHPPLWVHGNTNWGVDYAVREAQGWIGMIIAEQRARGTLRTRPIPDMDAFARRVGDVRAACERAGRDPATLDIISTGSWGLVDLAAGLDAEQMRDDVGRLDELGVDWIGFNICGNDPDVSIETVEWFAAEVIDGWR